MWSNDHADAENQGRDRQDNGAWRKSLPAEIRTAARRATHVVYAFSMAVRIDFTDDPAHVLRTAGGFLALQPVLHNLVISILDARVKYPEPGRYWMAIDHDRVAGIVLQSPLTFPATLTPMSQDLIAAVVDAIVQARVSLPGVNGEAATAASFAGHWAERCKAAATPFQGNRLYELLDLGAAPAVRGKFRQAGVADRSLMIRWQSEFQIEVGEDPGNLELRVDRGIAARELWLWEDGEPVSMAVGRSAVEGVVRVVGVYTPPGKRKHGYAEACVHALSRHLSDAGYRAVLYTDLANPTSNSIYRRIGYQAVAEVLRYRFA